MSLTLSSFPVTVDGGTTLNVLPGYAPIYVEFTREDIAISSVGDNAGSVQILVSGDISSQLEAGQGIYLYATGNYDYDVSTTITSFIYSAPYTYITIDVDFINTASTGYCNYLKNYYLELKLVNADNDSIDLLGFSLQDDGTPSGNIKIDVNILNHKNSVEVPTSNVEAEDERQKYNIKYREIYTGSSNSFTTYDNPIIAVPGCETFTQEEVISSFDEPIIWEGYKHYFGLYSNDDNNAPGKGQRVTYDELDINQANVTTDNYIQAYNNDDYGLLGFIINTDDLSLDSTTKYIKFKNTATGDIPQYNPLQYNNSQYNTI